MMRSRAQAVLGLAAGAVAVAMLAPSAVASATSGHPSGTARPAAARVVVHSVADGKVGKPGKPVMDPVVTAAARKFGLSAQRIEQGLVAVKVYVGKRGGMPKLGLLDPGVLRVFAKSLGISVPRARAVMRFLLAGWEAAGGKGEKPGPPVFPPAAVAFFAKTLNVPVKTAQAALDALAKLAQGPRGTIDPASPQFAKIAQFLGTTPKKLEAAMVALKKFMATLPQPGGKPPKK